MSSANITGVGEFEEGTHGVEDSARGFPEDYYY